MQSSLSFRTASVARAAGDRKKPTGRCANAGDFVSLKFNAPVTSASHPLGVVGDFENNKVGRCFQLLDDDILLFVLAGDDEVCTQ